MAPTVGNFTTDSAGFRDLHDLMEIRKSTFLYPREQECLTMTTTRQYPAIRKQDACTTEWDDLSTCYNVAKDVNNWMESFQFCRKHWQHRMNRRISKRFQPKGPLEFVTWISSGPCQKQIGNKFIFVTTDSYSKPARTITAKMTTATDIKKIFVDDSAIPYGISKHLLTGIGPLLQKNILNAVFVTTVSKLKTKTFYHPQTNE